MTLLVTGGAGFIGSHFIADWLAHSTEPIVNIDALTYAGHRANLSGLANHPGHHFVHADIRDRAGVASLLATHRPRAVVHFAAQTHVDRSIEDPGAFLQANIDGTYALLEACRAFWQTLPSPARECWRLLHISTDEVYGSLDDKTAPATELNPYRPSSPYAASKAASDHLVNAWHRTYGLPVLLSHCSNNYGPRQHPEKLIPLVIQHALAGAALPIYGNGRQRRDWLHVGDHCEALRRILADGTPGTRYNIGSGVETDNLTLVAAICAQLDMCHPLPDGRRHAQAIRHVADRPGHDTRYALDTTLIQRTLGWRPKTSLAAGLRDTVDWYIAYFRASDGIPT